MTKLFIDDLRRPPDTSWILARSVSDAIVYVSLNGCPDEISFDYCLTHGKNVMPFIEWLIGEDKKNKGFIPSNFKFDSHSSSSAGTELILSTLNSYLQNR